MNFCLWLTGLPGSGKTTIRRELEKLLVDERAEPLVLAMDELRGFLTPEPRYTEEEREIVYRAVVLMARFLVEHGRRCVIIDATGNRRHFRNLARDHIQQFAEVYIKCPVETCKARESSRESSIVEKDMYRKALQGRLNGGLPGVTAPYEVPTDPEVVVDSDVLSPVEAAQEIMRYLRSRWLDGKM